MWLGIGNKQAHMCSSSTFSETCQATNLTVSLALLSLTYTSQQVRVCSLCDLSASTTFTLPKGRTTAANKIDRNIAGEKKRNALRERCSVACSRSAIALCRTQHTSAGRCRYRIVRSKCLSFFLTQSSIILFCL